MENNVCECRSGWMRLAGMGLVAIGIFFVGLFIKAGIDNMAFRDRTVTVRGLAERQVQADYVTWPMSYNVAGDDLASLYTQISGYNDIIVKFLTSNGIARDEVSVNPPDTYNAQANLYGNPNLRYKYSLTCNITVATTKVEKVRQLLDKQMDLLRQGVPVSNGYINYEFRGLNNIKPAMIAEATKNAREAAQQFAKDSDSKVGKMKTASQGQFSIDDTSSSTPFTKNVRVVSTIVFYLED